MRYYTTEILSAKQELTPEGFLLCRDVPIARTGTQLYAADELPSLQAVDGILRIERLPEEVFSDRTIDSFQGKPITLDHPSEDVTPDNWSRLAKGIVQNVRRGSGIEDDLLLADFLITDKAAIQRVRDEGLREVSCGYDARYEQIEPGRGKQTGIVGNHVALVDKGRCGSRCAIGDSMKKLKWIDRIRTAFKSRDEAELEEALKESTGDEAEETEEQKKKREEEEDEKKSTSDALKTLASALDLLSAKVASLDKKSKDEEEEETEEQKKKREAEEAEKEKTGDSAAQLQELAARVEILAPGMAFSTTDAATGKTADLCAIRRKALEAAHSNPKTRDAVAPLIAGRDLAKLTCDALNATFIGASEIVRHTNNAATVQVTFDAGKSAAGARNTISDMNRRAAEFWNGK